MDKKIIACSNKRNVIVERIIRTVKLHQNAQKQVSRTKYDKLINSFSSNKMFYYFIVFKAFSIVDVKLQNILFYCANARHMFLNYMFIQSK